jgi:Domain of unknown function (DUF4145)
MSTLIHDCPHCLGRNQAFQCVTGIVSTKKQNEWSVLLICPGCSVGTIAVVRQVLTNHNLNPHQHHGELITESIQQHSQFILLSFFPEVEVVSAPKETPEDIAKSFITGSNAVKSGDTVTAAMHFRRALDLSFKELYPNLSGMLSQKIKGLKKDIELPSAMIEWAAELNIIGNEGNHDFGSPELQDVKDFQMWLELFLEYSFSIPRRLKAYREKKSQ